MKAISFLGAGQAFRTEYCTPNGGKYVAPYFPAALVHCYEIETLFVLVTKKARDMHFDNLVALAEDALPREQIKPVDIPDGRNETELWEIFQQVADVVSPGDRLIFDITHAFRSLPFLSFLAAAYLRAVKDVKLEAILYGAFEAGDRSVEPSRTPVIDLTRFVTLLDWLSAADHFTRAGDASDLAALLRDRQATPVHLAAAQGDQRAQEVAGWLRGAAAAIEDVSQPLGLVRPLETMQAAVELERRLDATREGVTEAAKPFALIADQVRQAYAPFGLAESLARNNCVASLGVQRRLLRWYVEHEQYLHAVTLAREWLVSYIAHGLGWDTIADRDLAEKLLSTEASLQRQERGLPFEPAARVLLAAAVQLWNEVSDLRNDLAHLGFRKGPRPVKRIIASSRALPDKFDRLPLEETA